MLKEISHCSWREGPEDFLFEEEGRVTSSNNEPELPTKIDSAVFWAGNWNKDIEFVHNQGLQINDDNDPAPQNTPQDHISFAWGCNDIDWRATLDPIDQDPNFQGWWKPAKKMLIDNFKKMTPYKFYLEVVIEQILSALVKQCLPPLTDGEFQY